MSGSHIKQTLTTLIHSLHNTSQLTNTHNKPLQKPHEKLTSIYTTRSHSHDYYDDECLSEYDNIESTVTLTKAQIRRLVFRAFDVIIFNPFTSSNSSLSSSFGDNVEIVIMKLLILSQSNQCESKSIVESLNHDVDIDIDCNLDLTNYFSSTYGLGAVASKLKELRVFRSGLIRDASAYEHKDGKDGEQEREEEIDCISSLRTFDITTKSTKSQARDYESRTRKIEELIDSLLPSPSSTTASDANSVDSEGVERAHVISKVLEVFLLVLTLPSPPPPPPPSSTLVQKRNLKLETQTKTKSSLGLANKLNLHSLFKPVSHVDCGQIRDDCFRFFRVGFFITNGDVSSLSSDVAVDVDVDVAGDGNADGGRKKNELQSPVSVSVLDLFQPSQYREEQEHESKRRHVNWEAQAQMQTATPMVNMLASNLSPSDFNLLLFNPNENCNYNECEDADEEEDEENVMNSSEFVKYLLNSILAPPSQKDQRNARMNGTSQKHHQTLLTSSSNLNSNIKHITELTVINGIDSRVVQVLKSEIRNFLEVFVICVVLDSIESINSSVNGNVSTMGVLKVKLMMDRLVCVCEFLVVCCCVDCHDDDDDDDVDGGGINCSSSDDVHVINKLREILSNNSYNDVTTTSISDDEQDNEQDNEEQVKKQISSKLVERVTTIYITDLLASIFIPSNNTINTNGIPIKTILLNTSSSSSSSSSSSASASASTSSFVNVIGNSNEVKVNTLINEFKRTLPVFLQDVVNEVYVCRLLLNVGNILSPASSSSLSSSHKSLSSSSSNLKKWLHKTITKPYTTSIFTSEIVLNPQHYHSNTNTNNFDLESNLKAALQTEVTSVLHERTLLYTRKKDAVMKGMKAGRVSVQLGDDVNARNVSERRIEKEGVWKLKIDDINEQSRNRKDAINEDVRNSINEAQTASDQQRIQRQLERDKKETMIAEYKTLSENADQRLRKSKWRMNRDVNADSNVGRLGVIGDMDEDGWKLFMDNDNFGDGDGTGNGDNDGADFDVDNEFSLVSRANSNSNSGDLLPPQQQQQQQQTQQTQQLSLLPAPAPALPVSASASVSESVPVVAAAAAGKQTPQKQAQLRTHIKYSPQTPTSLLDDRAYSNDIRDVDRFKSKSVGVGVGGIGATLPLPSNQSQSQSQSISPSPSPSPSGVSSVRSYSGSVGRRHNNNANVDISEQSMSMSISSHLLSSLHSDKYEWKKKKVTDSGNRKPVLNSHVSYQSSPSTSTSNTDPKKSSRRCSPNHDHDHDHDHSSIATSPVISRTRTRTLLKYTPSNHPSSQSINQTTPSSSNQYPNPSRGVRISPLTKLGSESSVTTLSGSGSGSASKGKRMAEDRSLVGGGGSWGVRGLLFSGGEDFDDDYGEDYDTTRIGIGSESESVSGNGDVRGSVESKGNDGIGGKSKSSWLNSRKYQGGELRRLFMPPNRSIPSNSNYSNSITNDSEIENKNKANGSAAHGELTTPKPSTQTKTKTTTTQPLSILTTNITNKITLQTTHLNNTILQYILANLNIKLHLSFLHTIMCGGCGGVYLRNFVDMNSGSSRVTGILQVRDVHEECLGLTLIEQHGVGCDFKDVNLFVEFDFDFDSGAVDSESKVISKPKSSAIDGSDTTVRLKYNAPYPLNILILTPTVMHRYNNIREYIITSYKIRRTLTLISNALKLKSRRNTSKLSKRSNGGDSNSGGREVNLLIHSLNQIFNAIEENFKCNVECHWLALQSLIHPNNIEEKVTVKLKLNELINGVDALYLEGIERSCFLYRKSDECGHTMNDDGKIGQHVNVAELIAKIYAIITELGNVIELSTAINTTVAVGGELVDVVRVKRKNLEGFVEELKRELKGVGCDGKVLLNLLG